MKKLMLIALGMVCMTAVVAQVLVSNSKPVNPLNPATAAFAWTQTEFDFGKIKVNNPVSNEFSFLNSGDAPLVIAGVKASCGCTVTDYSKEPIEPGTLFICPPDYHVLIESDESFSLDASEKVNFSRPSLDVVFRSAADVLGRRVVAILLSGANADGANGLAFVQEKGGTTVVQDPAEAQVGYMPQQALKVMQPDLVMSSASIGKWLNQQPQV